VNKGHTAPEFSTLIDFSNSDEVGLTLSRINADTIDYDEMKALTTNLIYRISFYMKNRLVTDADNLRGDL
jgi:hypothetical protein